MLALFNRYVEWKAAYVKLLTPVISKEVSLAYETYDPKSLLEQWYIIIVKLKRIKTW